MKKIKAMFKYDLRSLCLFLVCAIFVQLFIQLYLSNSNQKCGEYVPLSHLNHPLLKMASQVKATSHIVTLIVEDMQSIEFLQNAILEVQKAGIKDYIIIARNETTCELLLERCYFDDSFQLLQSTFNNNNKAFNVSFDNSVHYPIAKARVWLELLQNNYSIFSIATNVFLRDNPLLYIDRTVDINGMREYPAGLGSPIWQTLQDYGLCCNGTEQYLTPYFIFMRASNCSINVVQDMIAIQTNGTNEIDALNIALVLREKECVVRPFQKDLFPNGFVGFLMSEPQRLGFEPVGSLNNWESNVSGLVYRAREMKSWDLDPPSRYETKQRKFITYSTASHFVTFFQERNYLVLTFMLSKILKREVILPHFHCYIGEPASCYVDVLFDPILLSSISPFLEHSFLSSCNPPLPKPCVIDLKKIQNRILRGDEQLLEDVLEEFFEKEGNCTLMEIKFPDSDANGFHLSLDAFPDRSENEEWELWEKEIKEKTQYNTHALFSYHYTWWVQDLLKENLTCVISDGFKTDKMLEQAMELGRDNQLYVLSTDPANPTPDHLYDLDEHP